MGVRKKQEKGKRLIVWIPNDERWLIDAIEGRIKACELMGIKKSQAEIVRDILTRDLLPDLMMEIEDGCLNEQKGMGNISEEGRRVPQDVEVASNHEESSGNQDFNLTGNN